jgi:accessory gene regulator B
MVVHFIDKLADQLIDNNTITYEDKELYTYGLQQGLVILLNVLTTIMIGFIFRMVWQSIAFMVAYIPLRSYAGGYHARTQTRCYLLSVMLNSVVLLAIRFIPWTNYIIIGIGFVAGVIIYLLAPVEDSNKPLDKVEVTVYKKLTKIILSAELVILMITTIFNFKQLASCLTISLFLLSGMLVLGKLRTCK